MKRKEKWFFGKHEHLKIRITELDIALIYFTLVESGTLT